MKTNNALAVVAIVALGLAAFNLIFSIDNFNQLTGYAGYEGNASIEVQDNLVLQFPAGFDSINWGSGYVNTSFPNAILDTKGNMTGGVGWDFVTQGLILENIGNVHANVELNSNRNADSFIGGTNPVFEWKISNNESNSCASGVLISSYTTIASGIDTNICNNLTAGQRGYWNSNSLRIDFNISVPQNAPSGENTVIITASGTPSV